MATQPKKPATKKQYKVKKKLILPVLKLEQGVPVYIKANGPIVQSKVNETGKKKADEKPADVMPVINLDTGEEMQIVVPAVVKSTLEETYPDAGYVGHGFEIVKGEKPKGKRYYQYTVNELEI